MSLKLAVLALLDVEPGSGYALLQRFRNSIGFFWQTTHQQLYKELHGLLEEGLLDCMDVAQSGKPDMKVYSLNTAGAAELDTLLHKTASPAKIRDPLLVKLFSGRRLPREALLDELEQHRQQHQQTLATYRLLQEQVAALPPGKRERYRFPGHTLKLGVMYEETWLRWCEEIEKEI